MVKRIGGSRRKTRNKFKKNYRERGKVSLRRYLQSFNEGELVLLKAEPAVQEGVYHARFHGAIGRVEKAQGCCYQVVVKDGGKEKRLVVHPAHLRRVV